MPENPEASPPSSSDQVQNNADLTSSMVPSESSAPATGRRAVFQDLRRQLKEEELANPGVQKLLLDMLEEADRRCESVESYIRLYHEADKKASILDERLNSNKAIEIFFGVGIGLGGTIIGLAPSFWEKGTLYGSLTLVLGVLLVIGATIGRIIKK